MHEERLDPESAIDFVDTYMHMKRYLVVAAAMSTCRTPVLDLGCGVGYGTQVLTSSAKGIVIGLDNSSAAIWAATMRYSSNYPCIADAQRLPFRSGAFRTVICFEVIEHVHRPDALLTEAYRVLQPGGTLFLSTPNRLNVVKAIQMLRASVSRNPDAWRNPHHVREFSVKELVGHIRSAGFDVNELHGLFVAFPGLYTVTRHFRLKTPIDFGWNTPTLCHSVLAVCTKTSRSFSEHPVCREGSFEERKWS